LSTVHAEPLGIEIDTIDEVLEAVTRHGDPLGLRLHDADQETMREHAERKLLAALKGASAEEARGMARYLHDDPCNTTRLGFGFVDRIDETTAALMASAGVDPLVLTWISVIASYWATLGGGGRYLFTVGTRAVGPEAETMTTVAAGVQWHASGSVLIESLPETILATLVGRPLSTIVSHPLLDERGLTITEVTRCESGWLQIDTDLTLEAIEVERLVELSADTARHD